MFRWKRRAVDLATREINQNRIRSRSGWDTARSVAGFGGAAPLRALTRITGRIWRPRDPAMFAKMKPRHARVFASGVRMHQRRVTFA